MMLRHLQRAGHRPIALVGGGTTKVGDPSGKDESRQLLTQAQIDANKRGIEASLGQVPDFGAGEAVLVDNDEWLEPARLHPVPARFRHAFHHQPHAHLRLGASCGWSASSR